MSRPAPFSPPAGPDPAPTIPRAMGFSAVIAALRDGDRCTACGKTRVVMNVAVRGRPFRGEKVSPETHCACKGGPAYVAPAIERPTAEVCEHCGEERSRAEFYREPCRGAAQPDGVPGPIVGEHSWVRVELDGPALESDL